MEQTVKEMIKGIVGAENFTDSLIDLISYATDGSEHKHRPEAAVWPTSTTQVSEILKLANKASFPVVPRGAGTGLAGLAVPVKGGVGAGHGAHEQDPGNQYRGPPRRGPTRRCLCCTGEGLVATWLFLPTRSCKRQGVHAGGECGHKRRRDQGCKIWRHQRLRPGPGGGVARRKHHAHGFPMHENLLRIRHDPTVRGFRGNPGGRDGDHPQDQPQTAAIIHAPWPPSKMWRTRGEP